MFYGGKVACYFFNLLLTELSVSMIFTKLKTYLINIEETSKSFVLGVEIAHILQIMHGL